MRFGINYLLNCMEYNSDEIGIYRNLHIEDFFDSSKELSL